MSPSRGRGRAAVALALVAGLAVALVQADRMEAEPQVLAKQPDKHPDKHGPIIDAACDVDGVTVSYDASYRATPATAGYRVETATIDGVAPTCVGATVTVELRDGETPLASGTADATGVSVPVTIASPPPAREVTTVYVEIAGGSVPVPEECQTMVFEQFLALTGDADVLTSGKGSDLVYGLEGDDVIRGDNKEDCLVGQAGNDTLHGDGHADVLIGGDGNDVLEGGNQDDLLIGGPGSDILRGGNGTDECRGGSEDTYVSCEVRS